MGAWTSLGYVAVGWRRWSGRAVAWHFGVGLKKGMGRPLAGSGPTFRREWRRSVWRVVALNLAGADKEGLGSVAGKVEPAFALTDKRTVKRRETNKTANDTSPATGSLGAAPGLQGWYPSLRASRERSGAASQFAAALLFGVAFGIATHGVWRRSIIRPLGLHGRVDFIGLRGGLLVAVVLGEPRLGILAME